MDFFRELWRRALTVQAAPQPVVAVVIVAAALALVLFAWPLVRTLVTVCHEAGHAVAALLVGRKLAGIRVHSDTSGLTLTKGRPGGPGMAFTLFSGYPAAAVVGLSAAILAGGGYSAASLWLMVILLAAMLLKIRNFYGVVVVLASGAVLALVSWFASPVVLPWIASGLAWLFLLAAPRPILELFGNRHPGTDAAQLAELTGFPRWVWLWLWLVVTLAALALGARWLLPLS